MTHEYVYTVTVKSLNFGGVVYRQNQKFSADRDLTKDHKFRFRVKLMSGPPDKRAAAKAEKAAEVQADLEAAFLATTEAQAEADAEAHKKAKRAAKKETGGGKD